MKSLCALMRTLADRLAVYLPVLLMGVFALGTWWLVRSAPEIVEARAARTERHEPDYFMRQLAIKTFDASGRMTREILGAEARHYPDTDQLEIDQVRIRAWDPEGRTTLITARRGLSNHDGTDVLLLGDARVVREAEGTRPRVEVRGETLRALKASERVESNQPVELSRDADRFTGDTMVYDGKAQVLDLQGRVRGVLAPRRAN